MIIPDHWAEARRQHRAAGRQVTVRRFGWSASSSADATAMAEQRAEEALDRLLRGEKLPRSEPKVPYNGAAGVPIREEVLARHGDTVITRNAYGARCLNTPKALFADVDFAPRETLRPVLTAFAILLLLAAVVGALAGRWGLGLGLAALSLILAVPVARGVERLRTTAGGGAEAVARRRLTRFLTAHPDWNVRVYRTPAGLRLLATHRPCRPDEPEVQAFFRAVGADPLYTQMCLNQQCFRARLTAKPWRIGIAAHLRPRPGVWPVDPARLPQRTAWVREYESAAARFAACCYIESLGSGTVATNLAAIVALHDEESGALKSGATLA
jgi:hypothetical protein